MAGRGATHFVILEADARRWSGSQRTREAAANRIVSRTFNELPAHQIDGQSRRAELVPTLQNEAKRVFLTGPSRLPGCANPRFTEGRRKDPFSLAGEGRGGGAARGAR